jgi:hypothetical protein
MKSEINVVVNNQIGSFMVTSTTVNKRINRLKFQTAKSSC